MIAYGGRRSKAASAIMRQLQSRDWGLLILDEVKTRLSLTLKQQIQNELMCLYVSRYMLCQQKSFVRLFMSQLHIASSA